MCWLFQFIRQMFASFTVFTKVHDNPPLHSLFLGKYLYWAWGTWWRSGWGTALQTGRSRVWFLVDSASNRNEYQEYFLGVKAAGVQGWQPCHVYVPIVLESVSLNFLEPAGPVKTCNGIALPYLYRTCLTLCNVIRWQPVFQMIN
jgi:hypothetical protein